MVKRLGHTKGGSHRRKKIDKIKMRNYYAKDLERFVPKVVEDKRVKLSKAEILKDYEDVWSP